MDCRPLCSSFFVNTEFKRFFFLSLSFLDDILPTQARISNTHSSPRNSYEFFSHFEPDKISFIFNFVGGHKCLDRVGGSLNNGFHAFDKIPISYNRILFVMTKIDFSLSRISLPGFIRDSKRFSTVVNCSIL